jgi:hypothetical protein
MSVTLRLREIPPRLELSLRDAVETVMSGTWCVTVSQSHVDGQWYLQLDGAAGRSRAAIQVDATATELEDVLVRLMAAVRAAAARAGGTESVPAA